MRTKWKEKEAEWDYVRSDVSEEMLEDAWNIYWKGGEGSFLNLTTSKTSDTVNQTTLKDMQKQRILNSTKVFCSTQLFIIQLGLLIKL